MEKMIKSNKEIVMDFFDKLKRNEEKKDIYLNNEREKNNPR